MGIFDRHLIKEILTATFFAVVVLCGVFLMGTVFKEARPLLVGQNPSTLLVLQFIWSVLPISLMFMIPCSFLAAILIIIGRMSSNNELTSIQMSGRSLYRVSLPIFILAIFLCGFSYLVNTTLAPQAKSLQKRILYEAVQTDPNKFLDPGVVKQQLKGQIVFVNRREQSADDDTIYGLYVFETDTEEGTHFPKASIYARKANLFVDDEKKQLRLRLYDAQIQSRQEEGKGTDVIFVDKQEPLIFDFSDRNKRRFKVTSMTSDEIRAALNSTDPEDLKVIDDKIRNSLKNELVGRYSFSLSCLALAFVGVPLGISAKRKETSTGFLISIGVAILYFTFFITANDKRDEDMATVQMLYWAPNVLALLIGAWLFKRAQKK